MGVNHIKRQRLKLIYNPNAGHAMFKRHLDFAIATFQQAGWQVLPYRTQGNGDVIEEVRAAWEEGCTRLVAVGGDGTVHQVVNGLMQLMEEMGHEQAPLGLGVIPAGTSNDLAGYLGLSRSIKESCRVVINGDAVNMDIGRVSGRYFVNSASFGLMSDVPHKVPYQLKNNLGKLAYYISAFSSLPEFRPFHLQVNTLSKDGVWERAYTGDTMLFVVLNSPAVASFPALAPQARLNDGLMDALIFRSCSVTDFIALSMRLLQGEHLKSHLVTYLQAGKYKVEVDGGRVVTTDMDGEPGPPLPWSIEVMRGVLPVFMP